MQLSLGRPNASNISTPRPPLFFKNFGSAYNNLVDKKHVHLGTQKAYTIFSNDFLCSREMFS